MKKLLKPIIIIAQMTTALLIIANLIDDRPTDN